MNPVNRSLHWANVNPPRPAHGSAVPDDSLLRSLDNVVFSDHAAWYSEEAMVELKTKVAANVADVLRGDRPTYPVNEV